MTAVDISDAAPDRSGPPDDPEPPTAPGRVVWSQGHAFVLEESHGRAFWCGVDDRCRPLRLTWAELERRGWSLTR